MVCCEIKKLKLITLTAQYEISDKSFNLHSFSSLEGQEEKKEVVLKKVELEEKFKIENIENNPDEEVGGLNLRTYKLSIHE